MRNSPPSSAPAYPNIWEHGGEGAFEYCAGCFGEMKRFLAQAAEQRKALMVYLL